MIWKLKQVYAICLSICIQVSGDFVGLQFSLSSYGSLNCTNSQYATGGYSGLCTNTPSGWVNVTCGANGSWILTEYALSNCDGNNSKIQGSDSSCTAHTHVSRSYFVQCLIPPYTLPPSKAEFGISSVRSSFSFYPLKLANYYCLTSGTTNASPSSVGLTQIQSGCSVVNVESNNYLGCENTLNMSVSLGEKNYLIYFDVVTNAFNQTMQTHSTTLLNNYYFDFEVGCYGTIIDFPTTTPTHPLIIQLQLQLRLHLTFYQNFLYYGVFWFV